ncbi:MAG: radical SAM protein [Deltaproteobacteria bacterium]|nr:radical SAM protein [Deltaproteobacteria bacterium]
MVDENGRWKVDVSTLKPSYCVWELTLACNLRCRHCGSRAGKPRVDELSTEECLGVVRSLARLGGEVITLSGGEPTMRPDWFEIASAIRDHGMIANMVTNGVNLSEQMARRMQAAGLVNVAVSIDGPKDVHEFIRGLGTFDKTCDGFKTLKDVGMSATVMTTVNSRNLHRLDEVYQLAVDLGADKWRLQLGKPMGNMDTNDDLVIKPKDLLLLLPSLYRLSERGEMKVGIGDSIGYYGPYDSQLRSVGWKGKPQRWGGCQAGLRAIGIEANGGVKGCLSMQAFSGGPDPFLEGNIRQRSLEEIWFDKDLFAYNRKFTPADLSGFCAKCRHRALCRGGARCVAAAVTGGVSEDPYCYYRVATLATRWPTRLVKRHLATAATAASVATLLFSGCGYYEVDNSQNPDPIVCEEVCCECDYGELPPGVYEECCDVSLDYGVNPPPPINCEEVCCECDYGDLPPEVYEECCDVSLDYGVNPPPPINCEEVNCDELCCDCDYGELPPDVQDACNQCCSGDDDEEP